MTGAPIWISEAEVVSLIDLGEAVTAVREGLAELAAAEAVSLPKTQARFPGGSLHATGASNRTTGYTCTKTWTHTKNGATPLVLLWSMADGALLAVIEAFALGQYRTAAVSGVATDLLAPSDASTLGICGTGAQALMQVAVVNAVRPLQSVRVWSPRGESRGRFRAQVNDALGLEATEAPTAAEATGDAAIVTLITRATSPFLDPADVAATAHVNAMGAIGLDRAEFAPVLLKRCDTVAVDDITAAQTWSAELREYYGQGDRGWAAVSTLADLVAAPARPPSGAGITLFKAMGLGLADLSIAQFVYERATLNGLGVELPVTTRSRPRLRSSRTPG